MGEEIRLETERVNGVCVIHDCERESGYLWRVVDIDTREGSVEVNTVMAEYCASHSQDHAEPRNNLHYIGSFERVD